MEKKLVAIVSNDPAWTYNLRREVIEGLLGSGYRVALIVGYGEKLEPLIEMGCEHYDVPLERHGMNPIHELQLIGKYRKVLKQIRPDAVLTYTLKPNSYAGFLCRKMKIPCIANVTGLGNPIQNGGIVQKITLALLKGGVKKAKTVFFQNAQNKDFLLERKIVPGGWRLLPGSGVNTGHFALLPYPSTAEGTEFVFISRVMRPKGIGEYLAAAKILKKEYPQTKFHICGFCEDEFEEEVKALAADGTVIFHGMIPDTREILKTTHCTVLPSYHEGMSNVLLESASAGRPVIASRIPGCAETFDEGVSGFGCEAKSAESLLAAMRRFLALSEEEKAAMGLAGRKKVETQFDRQIVVRAYLDELNEIFA